MRMRMIEQQYCPLCQRVGEGTVLHAHIELEHVRLKQEILALIRAYHPNWTESAGVCWPCWKNFRDAAQALCLLKNSSPKSSFR